MNISSLSTQYIPVEVTGILPNNTVPDLSLFPVYLTFLSPGTRPSDNTTWIAGSWATDTTNVAQLLIGPEGYQLAAGSYSGWVKVSVPPQEPIIEIGLINIY